MSYYIYFYSESLVTGHIGVENSLKHLFFFLPHLCLPPVALPGSFDLGDLRSVGTDPRLTLNPTPKYTGVPSLDSCG